MMEMLNINIDWWTIVGLAVLGVVLVLFWGNGLDADDGSSD